LIITFVLAACSSVEADEEQHFSHSDDDSQSTLAKSFSSDVNKARFFVIFPVEKYL
jgi:hypothetical protein